MPIKKKKKRTPPKHETGLLPFVRVICNTQPWRACPMSVLSAGGSQQQFQPGTDFTGFPKVSALAQIPA